MKKSYAIGFAVFIFVLVDQAAADPMKCVVEGRTLYTDDPAHCAKGSIKPIAGSVLISSFPKHAASQNSTPTPIPDLPSGLDGILQHFGLSQQEVDDGWKTVMDARKRGSWQAPELPDAEK